MVLLYDRARYVSVVGLLLLRARFGHMFHGDALLLCHEAKDTEDCESSKYTCATVCASKDYGVSVMKHSMGKITHVIRRITRQAHTDDQH